MFCANGRDYRLPLRPTLAVCIDGTGPEYLDDALARGLMPRLARTLEAGGARLVGRAQVPTLTNVNNATIVTGVCAARHGIGGNHYLAEDGAERQLTDPQALRTPTILAAARRAGVGVLAVTAKDKLRRLLGAGEVPSISAERAHEQTVDGLTGAEAVGAPPPDIYDPALSLYAFDMALALAGRTGATLVYCSFTDYVQHKAAPGEPMADALLRGLDARLGIAVDAGWVVGMAADHGMGGKTRADGSPNVVYLGDVLARLGVAGRVILPITDPYVVHHGAFGSLAWIHVAAADRARVRGAVAAQPGVEAVLDRAAAARVFELPPEIVGDVVVCGDARTVFGKTEAEHDLGALGSTPLRSHGGLHEQPVPIVVCDPLHPAVARRRDLRNADLFDLLLNCTAGNGARWDGESR